MQYSLLHVLFNYMCLDQESVIGLGDLSVDVFLEVQNKSYNIVSNTLYVLWGSFMVYNINAKGHLPKTYFPISWLSDNSEASALTVRRRHPQPRGKRGGKRCSRRSKVASSLAGQGEM